MPWFEKICPPCFLAQIAFIVLGGTMLFDALDFVEDTDDDELLRGTIGTILIILGGGGMYYKFTRG